MLVMLISHTLRKEIVQKVEEIIVLSSHML